LLLFLSQDISARWRLPAFALAATALYFTHGFVFAALSGTVGCLVLLDFSRQRLYTMLGLLPGLLCLATILAASLKPEAPHSASVQPFFAPIGLHTLRTAFVWLLNPHGWGFDTYFALAWVGALGFCTATAWGGALRKIGSKNRLEWSR